MAPKIKSEPLVSAVLHVGSTYKARVVEKFGNFTCTSKYFHERCCCACMLELAVVVN